MTQSNAQAPRANRRGGPCPRWCAQDHSRPLVPGKPEHGFVDGHWSGFNLHTGKLTVQLSQKPEPGSGPEVCLTTAYGQNPVFLTPDQADNMATLIELEYGRSRLALLLCTAAATAREAQ